MALFDGQEALDDIKRVCRISAIENNDSVIVYIIRIEVGSFFWTVRHRYSEFYELNEKLIQQHNLEKSILPPKKLFGNHSDRFVRKRQSELEAYLQNVIEICQSKNQPLPVVLRKFLDFNRYEVRGITQTLSESFYHYGDSILAAGSLFTMTPLQLSSLTERLKLAEPTYDSEDKSKDLGHVLDFTSQLVRLHIEGSDGTIGQSNLVMNKLLFDLSCFKSVKELQVYNCDMKSLKGVGNLRSTLKQLIIKNSLHNIHDVLLCDVVFWPPDDETMSSSCWNCLESIQLRQNKIQQIDISMKLLKNVMTVDISHNLLSEVSNLETLPCLTNLNLSNNKIQYLDGLHTKLGNIRNLDLSSNHIVKLDGLSKLYSLESLNLSHNKIEELSEIQCLSTLPCLESLKLTNNPVTTAVDYRIKTLVFFASRISEITLDDKVATQKEKDTVAVIHAIKVSKEAKHENPLLNKPTKSTTHNVQLSSSDEQSSHDSAGSSN
ncbi:Nischarin [Nymphon striatum]|nr:Nischarin [Nymphon striatum]